MTMSASAGVLTGPRFKWIRRRLGFTQAALAQRLGIHRVTVADYERSADPIPLVVSELMRCWWRERQRVTLEHQRQVKATRKGKSRK